MSWLNGWSVEGTCDGQLPSLARDLQRLRRAVTWYNLLQNSSVAKRLEFEMTELLHATREAKRGTMPLRQRPATSSSTV